MSRRRVTSACDTPALLARHARQRNHEARHEEEPRRDRHAGESREELQDAAEYGRRPGRQLFRGSTGVEHQRGVIQRHVRDQQTAEHVHIGLARAGRADGRGSLGARGGGQIFRHGHIVVQPQCSRPVHAAGIDP